MTVRCAEGPHLRAKFTGEFVQRSTCGQSATAPQKGSSKWEQASEMGKQTSTCDNMCR